MFVFFVLLCLLVIGLCVTSTSNPDPVKALKSMYDANHPHMLFKTNNVDTDVFLFYVLLQDSSNQDQVK